MRSKIRKFKADSRHRLAWSELHLRYCIAGHFHCVSKKSLFSLAFLVSIGTIRETRHSASFDENMRTTFLTALLKEVLCLMTFTKWKYLSLDSLIIIISLIWIVILLTRCTSIRNLVFYSTTLEVFYFKFISSLKKGWFKQWLEKEEHAMRMCFRKGFMDS